MMASMLSPNRMILILILIQVIDCLTGVYKALKSGTFNIRNLSDKFKNDVGILLYLFLLAPAYQMYVIQMAFIAGWSTYLLAQANSIITNLGLQLPNINNFLGTAPNMASPAPKGADCCKGNK